MPSAASPRTVGSMTSRMTRSWTSARHDGRRRIRAHAARVRAAVAVVARLVVLRARERHDARAVDDGDEARFLADEKVLDDDGRAGLRRTASAAARGRAHARPRRCVGAMMTPLPAASPSALMTIGGVRVRDVVARGREVRERLRRPRSECRGARRNAFVKAFEPSSCAPAARGPKHLSPAASKVSTMPRDERHLGAHDRSVRRAPSRAKSMRPAKS